MSWEEIIKNDESDSRCKHIDWVITKLEQNNMTNFNEGIITFTTKCPDCGALGYVTYKNAEEDFIQWDDDGK